MNQEIPKDFVQNFIHDFNNPLSSIKGFATLLKDDLKDSPDQLKMIEYILHAADDLEKVVSNGMETLKDK